MSTAGRAGWQAWLGLAVLAACLLVVAGTPGDAYWINDCGNKAIVAQRLADTHYRHADFATLAPALYAGGRWFPIPPPFAVRRGAEFLSAYPPAFAALAAPLARLGPAALRLPAALGAALAAALFAAWTAPALGRPRALLGGLVLGLATPLFFYGITFWEHSLTVALGLGAWLLLAQGRPARWLAAGMLVGASCWLREELALLGVAALAAALLRREPLRLVAAFALGLALPCAGLLLFNQHYFGQALGGHVLANLSGDARAFGGASAVERLTALPGLFGGFGHGEGERWAFVLVGLGLPVAGLVAPRRVREAPWAPPVLAAAALLPWALAFSRMRSGASPLQELVLHNGLLLQWPMIALAGLGARRVWEEPAFAAVRTGALAGVLFALLVVAGGVLLPSGFGVQVGAGVHWGPRVLLPALPAFVLFGLAALRPAERGSRLAWGALAAAGLLSSGLAVEFLAHQKLDGARLAARLRAQEPRVIVTGHPLLAQHLASLWSEKAMLLATHAASLQGAVEELRQQGERGFLLVSDPGASPAHWLANTRCELAFRYRGSRLHYLDLDVEHCRLPAAGARRGRVEGRRGRRPPS